MKKQYLSVLNVVSCFSVIALHVNGNFWVYSNTKNWIYANIIESVFYFAVPIFFMITGATLLNYKKKYSTAIFFKKRVSKAFLPFIFWSVIAAVFLFVIDSKRFAGFGIRQMINGLLLTEYNQFFWYFPALFSVYLSIPLFASLEEKYKKRTIEYLIVVALIINVGGMFVTRVMHISVSHYFVAGVSGYLIFVLLGFYISEYGLERHVRRIVYILGLLGLGMHIVGTHILSMRQNEVVSSFKEYLNLPSVLYATAIFTFFKYMKWHKLIIKMVGFFEKQTFGIFLVHWFILKVLDIYRIQLITLRDKLMWTFGVFIVSWLIVLGLQRIPLLRKMV